MLKVAITGNIASGKSVVEDFLTTKGFKVIDSDVIAHDLLEAENVKNLINEAFIDYDISENNQISRLKLGKIVFQDDGLRKKLENILHPIIKNKIEQFFQLHKNEKFVFVSVPLLFEAKFESLFDKIILIFADDKVRLERLINRNNLSLTDAKNRLNSQISQDEKTSLADYVIYNNKTVNDLYIDIEKKVELL